MPGMDLSDSELMVMATSGDAEAYRRLFDRYQHPVYNFVYRLLDNAEDAADVVQDAFIKVYIALERTEVRNFSAYLYRTAKNLAYDVMRRRSRFVDVDHELLAPEDPSIYADPQRALLLGEQIDTVRAAARGLNENQRAALIMRELEELDYDEISEVLDSNRNAVGALLSRARLKFREELRMAQVKTSMEGCPPDCEDIIAMLSPYIDGELGDGERQRVESHLEGCAFCMAALEEMREASRSFRMLIPVVPPASVAKAVTGRLAELTGEGGGGGTDDGAGRGRPSGSNLLRRKAFWIPIIAAVILLLTAGTLVWGLSGEDQPPRPAILAGTSQTATATVTTSQPETKTQITPAAEDSGAVSGQTPDTSPGTQTVPTDDTSFTPVQIISGSASPNFIYKGGSVSFDAEISGKATEVSVELSPQSTGSASSVSLSRVSGGGGSEIWSGSRPVDAAGIYTIYIFATDSRGNTDSYSAGTLTVSP